MKRIRMGVCVYVKMCACVNLLDKYMSFRNSRVYLSIPSDV